MRQAEEITDEAWPVGGTRLRPSFANDEPWGGIGNVAAVPEQPPAGPDDELDDDWEKLLAAALGVNAPAAPGLFAGSDADGQDGDNTDEVLQATAAPEPERAGDQVVCDDASGVAPDDLVAGEEPLPEPARLPGWTGDDILPYSRNRRNRWRVFRR